MKVFNYSELHFSEETSFKIHTLVYAKKSMYIKNLSGFCYIDAYFTWQNPTNFPY